MPRDAPAEGQVKADAPRLGDAERWRGNCPDSGYRQDPSGAPLPVSISLGSPP